MADLVIPPEYEDGFVEMRGLDEGQLAALVSALEGEPPTLNRSRLRSRVASKVSAIARSDLDRVMEVLASLYALRESMGRTLPDFADAICDAMDESDAVDLWFEDGEDRERFKARLMQLLGIESLDLSAKATDLMYEHEHTVHGPMRILTDVRPIFGSAPEGDPKGAVIVHTLKISYHEGRQVKEFFISLDSDQVGELMGVLQRANLKAESLKRTLAGTNVPHIEAD